MPLETYEASTSTEFFKPKDHKDAYALLIEVKRDAPQTPGYQGQLKNAVYADVSVFLTQAHAISSAPVFFPNARIDAGYLYTQLNDKVGLAIIRKLGQKPPKNGNQAAWCVQAVDEETYKVISEYYQRREAQVDAAVASDNLPDFLK